MSLSWSQLSHYCQEDDEDEDGDEDEDEDGMIFYDNTLLLMILDTGVHV